MKASRLVLIGVAAGGALAVGAVVLHRRRLAQGGGAGTGPERVEQAEPAQPVQAVQAAQAVQAVQRVQAVQQADEPELPQQAPPPAATPVERLAAELDIEPKTIKPRKSRKVRRASAIVLTGGVVAAAAVSGVVAFSDSGADSATDPAPAPQTVNVAAAQAEIRSVTAKVAPGTRTATAMCPPGFRVISGGGFATGAKSHSAPVSAVPFHGPNGDGFTTIWSGVAAGADENAAATCAKGLSDVGIVSKVAPGTYRSKGQTWVPCPTGTRVLGFGGQVAAIDSKGPSPVLSGLGPVKRGRGGYVQAVDTATGTARAASLRLTAYAVCAKAPAKWQVRTWTSASTSTASKDHKLLCPADTRRLGGGFTTFQQKTHLMNAFGAGAPDGITGAKTTPNSGGSGPWRLRVTAVCAR